MFDTHDVTRTLTDADFTPTQADAVTKVVRQAAEEAGYVTGDQFQAGTAELRAETAQLDKRVSTQLAEHDARQSKQTAEARAEMQERFAEMRERFAEVNGRFAEVNGRFAEVQERFAEVRERIAETKEQIAALHAALANVEKNLSQQNAALRESLIRWVVGTVVGMLVGVGGLILGILRLIGFFGSGS